METRKSDIMQNRNNQVCKNSLKNIASINWEEGRGGSEEERRFLQLLEERGWEQRVMGVTRPLGGNTLDLATGPPGLLEEYELLAPLGGSDHMAVQL